MGKSVFFLALPIILENILQTLLGTVDTYFAGQLGDQAIAGIGVTNLVVNLFISFYTALSVGAGVVTARAFGRGDREAVGHALSHALVLGGGIGLGCGLVCLALARPILRLSGAEGDVIACALPYFLVVAVPSVVLCLQLILSSGLRAMKDTKSPMYVTVLCNLLNILLNVLLIKLGLGVLGLGLATTLSRLAGSTALFLLLRKKLGRGLSLSGLNRQGFAPILRIGLPAGGEKLIMRVGQLVYSSMILSMGTGAYVAHNVAGSVESYSYIPAMGFGLAVTTLVGVSLGEGSPDKARQAVNAAYFWAVGIMVPMGLGFFLLARPLTGLFTHTPEVQALAASVLRLIAFFQPFAALVQVMTGALQGAGDTKFPMYSTLLGIWGIRLGLGWLLAIPLGLGLLGVWWAYALDVTVRGILLAIRFRRGAWQSIKL